VPETLRAEAGRSLGLMVIGVTPDGPAAQGGVLLGDILVAVGGEGVGSPSQLAALLGPQSVGTGIELRLIRAGTVQAVGVTLGARPA
jgi:serine protease DegQ